MFDRCVFPDDAAAIDTLRAYGFVGAVVIIVVAGVLISMRSIAPINSAITTYETHFTDPITVAITFEETGGSQ